ncbi:MAG: DUF885 family protein [Planctomycetota bacterium]
MAARAFTTRARATGAKHLTALLLVCGASGGCGLSRVFTPFAPSEVGAGERLDRRLNELWLEQLDRSPALRIQLGEVRSAEDAKSPDARDGDRERRDALALIERALAALQRDFDARGLSPEDARFLDRTVRVLRREATSLGHDEPPRPHAWAGVAVTAPSNIARLHPARRVEDLRRWTLRLSTLAHAIDAETARVRGGLGAARLPRPILEATLETLTALGSGAERDPLLAPFMDAVKRLPASAQESLQRRARQVVRDEVRPAYGRLIAALESVRGRTGEDCGAWRSPDLEAEWLARLADAAGADYEPFALYELGRAEVQRLHERLGAFAPDPRDLSGWFDELRESPSAAPGYALGVRPAQELWGYVYPALEGLVAGATADVPEVSLAESWEWPRGRWSPFFPGTEDSARRPRVLVPREDDPRMPRWMREVRVLRYGLPGRALYEQLVTSAVVPRLLAHAAEDAHAEGWSLWVTLDALETLPELERDGGFARIATELVEAAALVTDIGLHERRWTRLQAVDYLREATPLPIALAEDLALRIAAEPGRAAAPFLGLVKLRGLERRAASALGAGFDRAPFRRALVDEGPLAPDELDDRTERWIEAQRRQAAVEGVRNAIAARR